MQHVVLATAGHIDHGKTELTRALTGIDTDRLPEEKERGITIDLGFAHAELGGRRVAIVDVPGHERFVKNMLAGVGGLDCALLVVAADESVMPQTREHLAILELLGVERGLIAITKSDLADAEVRELVRLEVAEFVQSTFLEGAPVIEVSARTGAGIDELRGALERLLGEVDARDASGPFRMPIDRAFTVRGFGSVVTGTVWSGSIAVGDEVEVSPTGVVAKVRGIEVHGDEASTVAAGARAALNLAGVDRAVAVRGAQLVPPGRYRAGSMIDVRLRLLADAPPLADLDRLRVHLGAAEVMARLRLLEAPELAPGADALAQLRLERPLLAWPGDRFIVRRYSPMATIGGGQVIDVLVDKHRGRRPEVADRLRSLEGAPLATRVTQLVRFAAEGVDLAGLVARAGAHPERVEAALARSNEVVRVDGVEPIPLRRALASVDGERARAPARVSCARAAARGDVTPGAVCPPLSGRSDERAPSARRPRGARGGEAARRPGGPARPRGSARRGRPAPARGDRDRPRARPPEPATDPGGARPGGRAR